MVAMKIAVVCYPTYGGSGVVATELAMAMAERHHEVHVVSYETPFRLDSLNPNLEFHGVEVGDYPLFRHQPYTLNLTNRLIELVEEYGVEVIHTHYAIPHAHAAWMAREVVRERGLEVRLACTLHGTDITLVGKQQGFLEITKFAIAKQDILTVPSRWLAEETEAHFGVPADDISVIPNFVDLERFHPECRCEARQRLAPNGEKIVVHASNYRPVKRVEDVIRGFAIIANKMPAVLALAGEGPELPKAEALARELGIVDQVHFLGRFERIETILQSADLFMLPSDAESFGLAALEAQACGVPVLGYRAGGLPEVVIDGETGILCPTGRDVCMGSVGADLLANSERHQAMSKAARTNAERFAPKPIIDQYEHMLDAVTTR